MARFQYRYDGPDAVMVPALLRGMPDVNGEVYDAVTPGEVIDTDEFINNGAFTCLKCDEVGKSHPHAATVPSPEEVAALLAAAAIPAESTQVEES